MEFVQTNPGLKPSETVEKVLHRLSRFFSDHEKCLVEPAWTSRIAEGEAWRGSHGGSAEETEEPSVESGGSELKSG